MGDFQPVGWVIPMFNDILGALALFSFLLWTAFAVRDVKPPTVLGWAQALMYTMTTVMLIALYERAGTMFTFYQGWVTVLYAVLLGVMANRTSGVPHPVLVFFSMNLATYWGWHIVHFIAGGN